MFDLPQNFETVSAYYYNVTKEQNFGPGTKILASIKIPSHPDPQGQTYATLPGCDPIDQARIIELFTIMGSHGKVSLLMNYKKHLEKLGKEIEHVHPIKLLGIIFSTPNMKPYMKDIFNDYFKWKKFIEGFTTSMNHEISKNNASQYLSDFAKDVKGDLELIKIFYNKRDWKGLINYLIHS